MASFWDLIGAPRRQPAGARAFGDMADAYLGPDEATPAGLAPGQMPVDPTRDGSVQPTATGRRLSGALGRFVQGGPAPMEPTLAEYQQGAEFRPGQTRRPGVLPITRDAQTGDLMLAMPKWADVLGSATPSAVGSALAPVAAKAGEMVLGSGPVTGLKTAKPINAHDALAALEAAIGAPAPGARQAVTRVDPNASVWDLYHGSTPGADFKRFDANAGTTPSERGAIFFAPDPTTASHYAGIPQPGTEAGSRVFRTTVDPGKTAVLDIAHLAETDPTFSARARALTVEESGPTWGARHDRYMDSFRDSRAQFRAAADEARAMGYDPGDPHGISFGYGLIGAAVERAKQQGLDTAILRGLAEHGGQDQVIALTPGRVRSYYAPDEVLYGGAPVGSAGGFGEQPAPPAPQTLDDLAAAYLARR